MPRQTLYLPIIERSDFEAFQTIMGSNLNYSFDRWLAWSAAWQMMNTECHIQEVRVSPERFEDYRLNRKQQPDLTTLLDFAKYVGSGQGSKARRLDGSRWANDR